MGTNDEMRMVLINLHHASVWMTESIPAVIEDCTDDEWEVHFAACESYGAACEAAVSVGERLAAEPTEE